tara:strand:- start:2528 stop:3004 length:477 start_codon:yes stop_codon:yes gene_type:complete
MIDQDRERFARIFTDMLITLSPREEHRVGVKAYFDALNHADPLPIEVIEQAGRQIQSRAGQKWFPTSGEWKELALQLDRTAEIANSANLLNAADSPDDGPTYYCKQCEDTSWRYNKDRFDKASGLIVSSVSRCPCQLSNPVLAAKRVRALDRVQGRTQ